IAAGSGGGRDHLHRPRRDGRPGCSIARSPALGHSNPLSSDLAQKRGATTFSGILSRLTPRRVDESSTPGFVLLLIISAQIASKCLGSRSTFCKTKPKWAAARARRRFYAKLQNEAKQEKELRAQDHLKASDMRGANPSRGDPC